MTINDNLETFHGKPVSDFNPEDGLSDPVGTAYALRVGYDASSGIVEMLEQLFGDEGASQLEALVIGAWEEAYDESSAAIVSTLVDNKDKLPALKALFIGDMFFEECEISWIIQSDMSPLFDAFPNLEEFGVRGGNELGLGSPRHAKLKKLVVETGGLDAGVVQGLGSSQLPNLEHLELWLGTEDYGGSVEVDDLEPILTGQLFPRLSYLGLRNAQNADVIAHALAGSPALDTIKVLDLSMGTLSDMGAEALAANSAITRLERLVLSKNYLTEAMLSNLRSKGVNVESTEQGDPDEGYRYCSVAE